MSENKPLKIIGETDFRELFHKIVYIQPTEEVQNHLAKSIPVCAEDEGFLAYGYIDNQAGFSFRIQSITIKFSVDFSTEDDPDIDEMSVEQLRAYLAELEGRLDEIESNEPDDNGSDAYDEWSDKRDELEDLISEVEDRLDELGD